MRKSLLLLFVVLNASSAFAAGRWVYSITGDPICVNKQGARLENNQCLVILGWSSPQFLGEQMCVLKTPKGVPVQTLESSACAGIRK